MNRDADYEAWLTHQRDVQPSANLTDRIIVAVEVATAEAARSRSKSRPGSRIGPILLWTAASLIFVARVAALVGNLVFPTNSYPEYAADQRIEETPHEHRSVSRS